MGTNKTYPGACFDCGGEVTVSPETQPEGVCVNCGPVGLDVLHDEGKVVEGFSVKSWADLQAHRAEIAANPPTYDPDDVPF
jgi:hypothetical protein